MLSVEEERVAKARMQHPAAVGVAEHGNSAVLVTVAPDGDLLDRRRIDLTRGLPTHPYHHEGSWAVGRYLNSPWAREISLADAVALVERVRDSASRGAHESLEALATAVPVRIASIAIRYQPRRKSGSPILARRMSPTQSCIASPWPLQPRRAAGPCIGMTASACFTTRRRRSAAKISIIFCR
jgi:hypothetical protein